MLTIKDYLNKFTNGNTTMSKSDLICLRSILKREFYLLKDLYELHDAYPDIVDKDIVGSYDALFRVLEDIAERAEHTYNKA